MNIGTVISYFYNSLSCIFSPFCFFHSFSLISFFCLSFPLSLFLIFLSLYLFHSLLSGSFCVLLPILNVQQLGEESALTKPWGKLALPVRGP